MRLCRRGLWAVLARRLADDFVVSSEKEDLGLLVVVGNAVDGQVVFGCFAFQQAFFSLFDGFDNRRRAGCIFVHADTEIDFSGRVSA